MPFSHKITHAAVWVKIPFLPIEYRTWNCLSFLVRSIGKLVKLDKFTTLQYDANAIYARVCVSIDISKPLPPSITLKCWGEAKTIFLSYEGVYECCFLCGSPDHFLCSCPKKPKECRLKLVVAHDYERLEDRFISDVGVVHHNPHINLDATMTCQYCRRCC